MDERERRHRHLLGDLRSLFKLPQLITPIKDASYSSGDAKNLFDNIKDLLQLPPLLEPISDWEEPPSDEIAENVSPQRKRQQVNNENSHQDEAIFVVTLNNIINSKVFNNVIKGCANDYFCAEDTSDSETIESEKDKKKRKKKSQKYGKSSKKPIFQHCDNILRIDCDYKSQVLERLTKCKNSDKNRDSVSRPRRERPAVSKQCSNPEQNFTSSYAPSTVNSLSYPATPSSSATEHSQTSTGSFASTESFASTFSKSSSFSFDSRKSLIQRLRRLKQPASLKYDSYLKSRNNKNVLESTTNPVGFHEKVLMWKQAKIGTCSGASTPVHGIEYIETPPGTPKLNNETSNFDAEFERILLQAEHNQVDKQEDDEFFDFLNL